MVDIHSHILPGVDDGASDFDETKAMIKMAYEDGCEHIFLTPHAYRQNIKEINKKYQWIKDWIASEHLGMNVYLGAEIRLDYEDKSQNAKEIIKKLNEGKYLTLNKTRYVLIEFGFGRLSFDGMIGQVVKIMDAGYIPVIAHVERYGALFEGLVEFKKIGCKFQINLSDVYGEFSDGMIDITNRLLSDRLVDFVGTDAHGIDRRRPEIKQYTDFLYGKYEKAYVDDILFNNAHKYLNLCE